jgi:hypothetical protein
MAAAVRENNRRSLMLRLILNGLLIFFILRALQPLFSGGARLFGRRPTREPVDKKGGEHERMRPDLSPYEIEDADYEEIAPDKKT